MHKMLEFLRHEDATTSVEYAVMLALIIMACIVTITAMGQVVGDMYGTSNTELKSHGF